MARSRVAQSKKRSRSPEPAAPLRLSKRPSRTSSAKSTPQKSIYREADSDDDDSEVEAAAKEESGYEDEDASAVSGDDDDDDDEGEEDNEVFTSSEEEDEQSRKRRKKQPTKANGKTMNGGSASQAIRNRELWREGVRVQGDGEVIIALPRARSPGKTPYRDGALHQNTFLFLEDLKRNNQREWLKLHDKDFRQSEKDWKGFVEALTEKLVEKDETIPELPYKDVYFRIYRDVRFSKDPTPYKAHFSAAFSRTGRKGDYAKYYIQVAPGKTFVAGGLWCPDAPSVALLRNAIDTESGKLKKVLVDPGIRKHYLGGTSKDEKKAVKAFCTQNAENALKTRPKVGTSKLVETG